MIQLVAEALVLHPARIAAVGAVLLVAWGALRRPNPMWIPAVLWLAYAGWEWLVATRTPEADLRVDMLLIWPVVGVATIWAAAITARRRLARRAGGTG